MNGTYLYLQNGIYLRHIVLEEVKHILYRAMVTENTMVDNNTFSLAEKDSLYLATSGLTTAHFLAVPFLLLSLSEDIVKFQAQKHPLDFTSSKIHFLLGSKVNEFL